MSSAGELHARTSGTAIGAEGAGGNAAVAAGGDGGGEADSVGGCDAGGSGSVFLPSAFGFGRVERNFFGRLSMIFGFGASVAGFVAASAFRVSFEAKRLAMMETLDPAVFTALFAVAFDPLFAAAIRSATLARRVDERSSESALARSSGGGGVEREEAEEAEGAGGAEAEEVWAGSDADAASPPPSNAVARMVGLGLVIFGFAPIDGLRSIDARFKTAVAIGAAPTLPLLGGATGRPPGGAALDRGDKAGLFGEMAGFVAGAAGRAATLASSRLGTGGIEGVGGAGACATGSAGVALGVLVLLARGGGNPPLDRRGFGSAEPCFLQLMCFFPFFSFSFF